MMEAAFAVDAALVDPQDGLVTRTQSGSIQVSLFIHVDIGTETAEMERKAYKTKAMEAHEERLAAPVATATPHHVKRPT